MSIDSLILSSKLILCLGAGGVGKTTTSIALAVRSAKLGRRTALLSIDPAKRLAEALGLPLSHELTEIRLDGVPPFHATMLDQKKIFDDLVTRFTKNPSTREKILDNRLYQACSQNFGGAIEYLAFALLDRLLQDDAFDTIILDTPPDSHALEFIRRPNVLAGFMDSRMMSWVIKPFYFAQRVGLGKIFSFGERVAGGISQVTGVQALQRLAEFLVLMQEAFAGFHLAGNRLSQALRASSTKFILITTPQSAPVRSALNMMEQLRELRFLCDYLIFNRCLPNGLLPEGPLPAWTKPLLKRRQAESLQIQAVIENLQNTATIVQKIEENFIDLQSADGIIQLSKQL